MACTWHSAACKSKVESVEYILAQFSKPQYWQTRLVQRRKAKTVWTVEKALLVREKDYTIRNPGMRNSGAWLWRQVFQALKLDKRNGLFCLASHSLDRAEIGLDRAQQSELNRRCADVLVICVIRGCDGGRCLLGVWLPVSLLGGERYLR